MTSTDYRPRVERAIRFIGENLDRPITLAEVAKVAHLSEYHFHRIFAAITGEPIGRFVTRRRLELAALRLAYEPSRSVTEIALAVGYSSTSNFSKAFSAHFGCAPSRVRHPDPDLPPALGKLTRTYGARFDPAALYVLPPDADEATRRREHDALAKSVRWVDFAGLDVACLASAEGYDLPALERTWDELIARGRALGVCDDAVDAYGMAFDSPRVTAPELCRYHACVPCPADVALPAPLFRGRIPAGRYAVFRYAGDVTAVEETYRRIYSVWLPRSGVVADDFVAVDHYVNDGPVAGSVDFEIWIKVRAREP
ncbi:AraC family transcriptional regulator [Sandaracinus amylolyticus]|uniref:Transcriptional regulator, AraC family protein n=1 Tax=Sandaracinus amylolyticus TaxID=927083 RepID=A0A0F6W9X2_9BACT|nr:helix-turn-helix domain-containing protein [Sandaracinus amylolyticus]AKF11083.1 Transcriptional regulator, AraC family protein [Sandaracinus amylolyticus]